MKRVIAVLLTLILLLSVLPIATVSAATYSGNVGSLKWSLDTSTGKLTISGNGAMPNYANAYSYGWYNYESYVKSVVVESGVTSIGDYAFYYHSNLTSLRLSNTVTSVGKYAFYNCDALATLTNTASLVTLGDCAFYDCDALTSVSVSGNTTQMGRAVYGDCNALTSVIVGNGAAIGEYAFSGCKKLSSLLFSTNVPVIGNSAFQDCDALVSVTLPEGLTSLGSSAFSSCDKLSSITVPSKVSYIGDGAFSHCGSLTGIYVAEDNNYYKSISGVLYTKDGTVLMGYPKGSTATYFYAPDTVASVAPYAFEGCSKLTSVSFSSSLTEIGDHAFQSCSGLRTVSFSGTVKTICEYAFSGCATLSSISLSGVELIEEYAFELCKSMTGLYITGSPEIEKYAFSNCYALRYLDLGDTYKIGDYAFSSADLRDITLPASLRYVGKEAFSGCLELNKITVLNPGCKFYGMESYETFSGLAGDVFVFHGYENSTAKAYADLYGHTFTAHSFNEDEICTRCGCSPYVYDDGYWSLEVRSGIAYIYGFGETVPAHSYEGPQSWQDFNYSITSLVIGNDVKVISAAAFKDQKAMELLNLVNVEEIGNGAFSGAVSLERLYLPDTLVTLGEQAFSGCTSMISAVLRPNLEYVGYNAFYGCSTLTEVSVLNPDCFISDYKFTLGDPSYTVICGFIPSTAYDYATKYGYTFYELNPCEYGFHHYEVESRVEAGCETEGQIIYKCSGCEEGYAETIAPLGHDMYPNEILPSCTEDGYMEYTCSRCSYSYQSDFVPATGHSYTTHEVLPTCTEQGYTEYYCSFCADSYIADYTEPTGHNYIPEIYPATCTEDGYTLWLCHGCSDSYVADYVAALGHTYSPMTVAPTCTEGGYTEYRCEGCGDSYIDDYTEPTGHDYFEGYCINCGAEDPHYTGTVPTFSDVSEDAWYAGAVEYVVENGLMNGTGNNKFEPDTAMTRAMLVTVLWRYVGEPMEGENVFTDVPAGQWYTDAVAWAAHNNIVGGVGDNRFDPNGNITREQMATILFRYASAQGIDTSARANLIGFPDAGSVSAYANDPLCWAVAERLISGSDGMLLPQGNATRAQVATILMRFIENVVK